MTEACVPLMVRSSAHRAPAAGSHLVMGLRSPVLLDQAGMSVGSTFGTTGTHMAILVDAEGKRASELAVGGPPVLVLARRGQESTARAAS